MSEPTVGDRISELRAAEAALAKRRSMSEGLIEDEDGAPYPELYAVRTPSDGLYVPYSGAWGVGSIEAAERIVKPNAHLGYEVVKCQLVPVAPEEPDDGWTCDACHSSRWVAVSLNRGRTRVHQCVPCGAIGGRVLD